jgi:hypothetical protein
MFGGDRLLRRLGRSIRQVNLLLLRQFFARMLRPYGIVANRLIHSHQYDRPFHCPPLPCQCRNAESIVIRLYNNPINGNANA